MRRPALLFTVFLLVLPGAALAGGPAALDLRTGVTAEMLNRTLALARSLLPLALVLGLLVEAFGGSATQAKNYGAVIGRTLLVVALLFGYRTVFGTVINTCERIAARIAPSDVWDRYKERMQRDVESFARRSYEQAAASSEATGPAGPPGLIDGLLASADLVPNYVGGVMFDSLVGLFVLLGQAFHWVFGQLSRILLALFYVLGPLAIVFHIPGTSKSAGKWFTAFVTIGTWPVLSALLLALANALMPAAGSSAGESEFASAFGAVASGLLMILLNLAVPMLASALVGGGVGNVIGSSVSGAVAGAMSGAAAMTSLAGAAGFGGGGGGGLVAGGGPVAGGGGGASPMGVMPQAGGAASSGRALGDSADAPAAWVSEGGPVARGDPPASSGPAPGARGSDHAAGGSAGGGNAFVAIGIGSSAERRDRGSSAASAPEADAAPGGAPAAMAVDLPRSLGVMQGDVDSGSRVGTSYQDAMADLPPPPRVFDGLAGLKARVAAAETDPGHPFDERRAWGDIGHLRPIGGSPPADSPPAAPAVSPLLIGAPNKSNQTR